MASIERLKCADTGRPDLYVYNLVIQFITLLNTASHCADSEYYAVLNYAYSVIYVFCLFLFGWVFFYICQILLNCILLTCAILLYVNYISV